MVQEEGVAPRGAQLVLHSRRSGRQGRDPACSGKLHSGTIHAVLLVKLGRAARYPRLSWSPLCSRPLATRMDQIAGKVGLWIGCSMATAHFNCRLGENDATALNVFPVWMPA